MTIGLNRKESICLLAIIYAKARLLDVSIVLKHVGASNELVIRLNDSGMSFDEIADYIDQIMV